MQVHEILYHYKKNPINAIESLFGVSLDDQQKSLVLAATQKDSLVAVKSGQGCGKTSTLVWLSIYFLLTMEDCRILITAPSSPQLQRVFRTELLKWASKMPKSFRDFFEIKKESFHLVDAEEQVANLVTGSPTNQEGLQGGHSKTYIVMADEASGIEEIVFDTLYGTLGASEDSKMILTSNPVRNSGRFYEIFQKENSPWTRLTFTVPNSSQGKQIWIDRMKEQYGEDSDNYKIRVLGEFGSFGEMQFFQTNTVEEALKNLLNKRDYQNFEKVGGLDVARFGDDSTVLCSRQGPKLLDYTEFKGLDTMEIVARAVEYIRTHELQCLYIDGIGIGAGVVDRLRELQMPIRDVVVSNSSTEPMKYANLRTQLYGRMKDWMMNGADILDDEELRRQLLAISYTYSKKMQLQLLGKKEIKRITGFSPDITDSVALTFADGIYSFTPKTKARRIIRRGIRI